MNQSFSVSLFKNDRKETEKQPDFTGPGDISKEDFLAIADAVTAGKCNFTADGKIKLRIAGWKRQSSSGKAYISCLVSVDDYGLDQAAATVKQAAATQSTGEDLF